MNLKIVVYFRIVICFVGNDYESSGMKRNEKHVCALKHSKRCAFCEIGFNDDEDDDVKAKVFKSLDLFEGISSFRE